jgi:carboxymethylenebutenolidase
LLVYGTPQEYPPSFLENVANAISGCAVVVALVMFSREWTFLPAAKPQLIHEAGSASAQKGDASVKTYTYPTVSSADFILPRSPGFSYTAASVAHSRSLQFVKEHLGGPIFDLEAIWDEHTYFEFVDRSVEKTMGTMVLEPYVNHIPTVSTPLMLRCEKINLSIDDWWYWP